MLPRTDTAYTVQYAGAFAGAQVAEGKTSSAARLAYPVAPGKSCGHYNHTPLP